MMQVDKKEYIAFINKVVIIACTVVWLHFHVVGDPMERRDLLVLNERFVFGG